MMRPYDRVLILFPHPEAGRRGTLAFQRPSGVWSVQLDQGGSVEVAPAFLRPDPYLPPLGGFVTMRAITIRQPWASCVSGGYKLVENRSRPTRYRGPLAIHAGAAWSKRGASDPRVLALWGRPSASRIDAADFPPRAFRSVLAVAELVDCHPASGCCKPWGEDRYVHANGRTVTDVWHLVLDDVRPLDPPVGLILGRLGLWTPSPLALDLINEALDRLEPA